MTESESASVQSLESHMDKLAEIAGITKNQAAALTGEARVGGGWDFIVRAGADGSAVWRGQTIELDDWNRMKDYAEQHQVTELFSSVSEASRRYSTATGESELASLDESLGANLTRMRRFEERASLSRSESESWTEQAAEVRADARAIDRELGQPFFAWLAERPGTDGRPIGAAGAMRLASPQTPEDAEELRGHAANFIAERFPAPAGPDPATVSGEAEYEAARDGLADAYTRETGAAHAGWAEGVRDRAYVAGAPIPGEVEAGALGERAETRADMTVRETGREVSAGDGRGARAGGPRPDLGRGGETVRGARRREPAGRRRVARGQALRDGEECRAGRRRRRDSARRRRRGAGAPAARLARGSEEVAPWGLSGGQSPDIRRSLRSRIGR